MRDLSKDYKVQILDNVILSLREDIGTGDITTNTIISKDSTTKAKIIAKEAGVICGLTIAKLIFASVDKRIFFQTQTNDGAFVKAGKCIAIVSGPARGILTAERTALNFLQILSGIATLTRKYVKSCGGRVKILDTRKTAPGLRILEKYAVKAGGGSNHRIGLFDAVIIKDNHLSIVGNVSRAVKAAKAKHDWVEVETKTLSQVKEAIGSGATRIMLDNMGIEMIKKAVKLIRGSRKKIEIEVSGGVTLTNVGKISKTGIDYISVGALTHSAPALDISLKISSR